MKVTLQLKASKDRKPIFQTIKQVAKGGLVRNTVKCSLVLHSLLGDELSKKWTNC